MAFLNSEQLTSMGFASVGCNVLISDKASFYQPEKIKIGNHVRIDDFCVISAGEGGIEIGNYVHIAIYSSLIGKGRIKLHNFCGLSSKVSIYSSNENYNGEYMTNPTVPSHFLDVFHKDVELKKHVIVGSGSIILPGVTLHEGVAIGALSLVNKDCEAFSIYSGNPAKKIKERKRNLLELEEQLLKQYP